MLVNTKNLTVAFATAAAVIWAVCSLLVALSPGSMTTMTGHMLHMDLTHNGLYVSLTGFIVGLIGWTALAGGFAWILASIYNKTAAQSNSDKPD